MSPICSYRDEGLAKIYNIDVYGDSWVGFYGTGFRALRLPPLLRTAAISELCRVDARGNEVWRGTHVSEDTVVVTTRSAPFVFSLFQTLRNSRSSGLFKTIAMTRF